MILALEEERKIPFSQVLFTGISFGYIGVGMVIVTLSSFLNSELKFNGWKSSTISFFLGIPILLESVRIYGGLFFDRYGRIIIIMMFSFILALLGLILLPNETLPTSNLGIVPVLGLVYAGSAVITTLIDAYMTKISRKEFRARVAGTLQTSRLTGFAVGGLGGSILYPRLSFSTFMGVILVMFILTVLISIFFIISLEKRLSHHVDDSSVENEKKTDTEIQNVTLRKLIQMVKERTPSLMSLYLILFSLGLFMQDFILETFAIDNFGFEDEGIGKITALWSSLTLIFVPVGVLLDKKFLSRQRLILLSTSLATFGLLLIAITSNNSTKSVPIFYLGIIFFGIGNGLVSAPGIATMLDVSETYPKTLGLLLAFFGLLITFGRFSAAIFAGLLLHLTNQSYWPVFFVEAIILLFSIWPIKLVIDSLEKTTTNFNNLI